MPPCIWIVSAQDLAGGVARVGLGRRAREGRFGIAVRETPGRAVERRTGRLGLEQHVGHAVLEAAWNDPIGRLKVSAASADSRA